LYSDILLDNAFGKSEFNRRDRRHDILFRSGAGLPATIILLQRKAVTRTSTPLPVPASPRGGPGTGRRAGR
jgi:uncharacterized integral membrane protein